jgi:hypothetical protein
MQILDGTSTSASIKRELEEAVAARKQQQLKTLI